MLYIKYVGLLGMAMQSPLLAAMLTHHDFKYGDILTKWSEQLTNSSLRNLVQALSVLRNILDYQPNPSPGQELPPMLSELFETQTALLDQWWKDYGQTGESHSTL
jgi:hypothetical protein